RDQPGAHDREIGDQILGRVGAEQRDAGVPFQPAPRDLGGERRHSPVKLRIGEFAVAASPVGRDQRDLAGVLRRVEQIAEIDGIEAHGWTTTLPNTWRSSRRLIASRPWLSGTMRSITGTRRRDAARSSSVTK